MPENRTRHDEAGLIELQQLGVISKTMTMEKLREISRKLVASDPGSGPVAIWKFWVKGKCVYTDDAPAPKA